MSYRESRASWRKLWRKEPARRQAELSYHARTLLRFLLQHADDSGCLGAVSKRGHPASLLAQALAVPSRARRAFYAEVEELLAFGDDGEPLALAIRDGHFFLTRFGECQAKRGSRDKSGLQPGQDRDESGTGQGPSLPPKLAEPFESETELGAEERGKRREERLQLIQFSSALSGHEEGTQAAALLAADPPKGRGPGSLAKRLYAEHFERRYGKPRTNLDKYDERFAKIEQLAARQPGPLDEVLAHVYRSFFADRSQGDYGQHSPATLANDEPFAIHVRDWWADTEPPF